MDFVLSFFQRIMGWGVGVAVGVLGGLKSTLLGGEIYLFK